jgi:hypothetical protein
MENESSKICWSDPPEKLLQSKAYWLARAAFAMEVALWLRLAYIDSDNAPHFDWLNIGWIRHPELLREVYSIRCMIRDTHRSSGETT